MPVVWYPKRWWNFYLTEDQKKQIEPILNALNAFNAHK